MKFGVSAYNYQRYDIGSFDAAEKAKKAGFDYIDFLDLQEVEGEDLKDTARRLREHCDQVGIEIGCYTVQADFLWGSGGDLNAEIERIKKKVDIAEALGVHLMRHDGSTGWPEGKEGTFDEAVVRISTACRELTAYAEQKGIRTMVENHGHYCQASERMEKIWRAVNHPNFGLLADMGNFMVVDEDPAEALTRLMPMTFMVHCKDFCLKPADADPGEGWWLKSLGGTQMKGCIFGHGDLDVKKYLAIVHQFGYDNGLTLEFEGLEDVEVGNRIGLTNMKRYWEELENAKA